MCRPNVSEFPEKIHIDRASDCYCSCCNSCITSSSCSSVRASESEYDLVREFPAADRTADSPVHRRQRRLSACTIRVGEFSVERKLHPEEKFFEDVRDAGGVQDSASDDLSDAFQRDGKSEMGKPPWSGASPPTNLRSVIVTGMPNMTPGDGDMTIEPNRGLRFIVFFRMRPFSER